MEINKNTINIKKLVADIKSGESTLHWSEWCRERGLSREYSYTAGGEKRTHYMTPGRASHMTSLYTLRAQLRSKNHRTNPPPSVRDQNRSLGRPLDHGWDVGEHNLSIAQKVAEAYGTMNE